MPPSLVVSVLDGTLLGPDARLSAESRRLLVPLIAAGLPFTVATARSWLSAGRLLAALPLRLPVVTYGGAVTVDPVGGGVVRLVGMREAMAVDLLAATAASEVGVVVYWMRDGLDRFSWLTGARTAGIRSYLADRQRDRRRMPVAAWTEIDRATVFAMTVIGPAGAVDPVAARVRETWGAECHTVLGPDLYHPDETWLEITAAGADKGSAVAALGLAPVVVYGDAGNDLPMFQVADEAVAVAGAVPALRAAATRVIGSNAEHAVAADIAARFG